MKYTINHAHWRVPSEGRAFDGWLEGKPTSAQRRAILAEVANEREKWTPSNEAWSQLRDLERFTGQRVCIQFWDPIMHMLEDEGPYPVRADCQGIVLRRRERFLQAYLILDRIEEHPNSSGYSPASFLKRDSRLGCTLAPVSEILAIEDVERSAGLFAGVDEATSSVFGLERGKHFGQLSTARKVARNPVRLALVDLVRRSFDLVSANLGDRKPSPKNWQCRLRPNIGEDTSMPEVVLERAVALLANHEHLKGWCNQIAVASGLIDDRLDKNAHVDLARIADGRLDLYELKWRSNNPVFAAFEVLRYGLAYLLCRVNKERFGYEDYPTMKVSALGLNVLAPRPYYEGFDLAWLQAGLDLGIREVSKELKLELRTSFRFWALPETESFATGAEAIAACGVTPLVEPRARALVHAMSNLVPVYPTSSSV